MEGALIRVSGRPRSTGSAADVVVPDVAPTSRRDTSSRVGERSPWTHEVECERAAKGVSSCK